MWLWIGAALAIEPGAPEVLVERLTPEMHWFTATAIDAEAVICSVGVPTHGDAEPIVLCSFPAGLLKESNVPRQLERAAKEARDAVREHLGKRIQALEVTYVATEQRAHLCDHTLLPNGFWATHHFTVGVSGGQAHLAAGTGRSAGGEGILGCSGRPLPVPAETSALLAALPAALAGQPTTVGEQRADTVPVHVLWQGDSRVPYPGGSEFAVRIPTDPSRVVGTRVTWLNLGGDGVARPVSIELTSGLPDDWTGLAGAPVPADAQPLAILEVFATDEPAGHHWTPEARGFERLWTSTLLVDPATLR